METLKNALSEVVDKVSFHLECAGIANDGKTKRNRAGSRLLGR